MLTPVRRRLQRYLSVLKRLSSPMEASKRLRGAILGGFLSSFSVLGAGMLTRFEVSPLAEQRAGSACVGVAFTPLQARPAWNSWSAVRPVAARLMAGVPSGRTDAPQGLFG